ncbi:hypothetical protein NDU88_007227 [Pleurodeles waltl]|uniref:Uncharacterized protein n=1 Tax=Pleurodeles waltl TaxID=8319 RepID=A0AAV7RUA8_PLEWA|nr:hypothetical protein NDU88_007227 [Pleurodeles waltl]
MPVCRSPRRGQRAGEDGPAAGSGHMPLAAGLAALSTGERTAAADPKRAQEAWLRSQMLVKELAPPLRPGDRAGEPSRLTYITS